MPDLRLKLMGFFSASVGGVVVTRFERGSDRLLAYLALHVNQPIPKEELIELLFDFSHDRMQKAVRCLKNALGARAGRIDSATGTLCLRLDNDALKEGSVDVFLFDRAVKEQDWESATQCYHDPLLQGWKETWVKEARAEREEGYVAALRSQAKATADAGNSAASAGYLRRYNEIRPFEEWARLDRMNALALSGERASALSVYEEFARCLQEAKKPAPSAEMTKLYRRLKEGAFEKFPSFGNSFVGREKELGEAREKLLQGARLLTLTGSGGSGKTRLAVQLAGEMAINYPEGAWFVEMETLSEPRLVPQRVASVLQVREEPGRSIADTLADFLAPRSLLLVLDCCEHLIGASASFLDMLLHACPNLVVVATSRELLAISAEVPYPVPALSLPDLDDALGLGAETLTQYAAIKLFVERTRLHQPDFCVTTVNKNAVLQICRQLDGLPLAIELAAARMSALTVEEIARRLKDCFRLLSGGRAALPKHQTLQAAMDWSYDLLSEREKALLRQCSVFVGGWTMEAAEGVFQYDYDVANSAEISMVSDLMSWLVNKSLVIFESEKGRYRLLETVHRYSQERLVENHESEAVRSRHQDFFLRLAEEAESQLFSEEQVAWLDRLETEHDNLRAALTWALSSPDTEDALRLTGALGQFWWTHGYFEEGYNHLTDALKPDQGANQTARAKALLAKAQLSWRRGRNRDKSVQLNLRNETVALCDECCALYGSIGDQMGVANSLAIKGTALVELGEDPAQARLPFDKSLSIWNQLVEDHGLNEAERRQALHGLGTILNEYGVMEFSLHNYEPALDLQKKSVDIRRELNDKRSLALSLHDLADVLIAGGSLSDAQACYRESLMLRKELRDLSHVAQSLRSIASLFSTEKDYERAVILYASEAKLRKEIGLDLSVVARNFHYGRTGKLRAALVQLEKAVRAKARHKGEKMAWEEAVQYALSKPKAKSPVSPERKP